jgi:hypothetical protein
VVVGALFGYLTQWPSYEGVLVVVGGVAIGGTLQRLRGSLRAIAPVPVVAGFATAAVGSPLGLLPELISGVSGLAILLWLADDLDRPAGGILRARQALAIPALALGIAWMSALLLPSRSASVGVAVGLLVFVIAALAYLIGQPALFDREEPSAS